ncbi:MAG: DUF4275 family protein [Arenicella sp.]
MEHVGYTVKPGRIIRVYSSEETAEIDKEWVKAYCKDKQGANIKDYRWHIFSFEKYPAISGDAALDCYKTERACEYIVLSNDGELAIETDELPTDADFLDFLVFPRNMAWTMAYTHEDGYLGPYFAKHKDYQQLTLENKRLLKANENKLAAIEIAKEKGWM